MLVLQEVIQLLKSYINCNERRSLLSKKSFKKIKYHNISKKVFLVAKQWKLPHLFLKQIFHKLIKQILWSNIFIIVNWHNDLQVQQETSLAKLLKLRNQCCHLIKPSIQFQELKAWVLIKEENNLKSKLIKMQNNVIKNTLTFFVQMELNLINLKIFHLQKFK